MKPTTKTKTATTRRVKNPHKAVVNYRQDMKPAKPRGAKKHG